MRRVEFCFLPSARQLWWRCGRNRIIMALFGVGGSTGHEAVYSPYHMRVAWLTVVSTADTFLPCAPRCIVQSDAIHVKRTVSLVAPEAGGISTRWIPYVVRGGPSFRRCFVSPFLRTKSPLLTPLCLHYLPPLTASRSSSRKAPQIAHSSMGCEGRGGLSEGDGS
jgi:hypothetical protein